VSDNEIAVFSYIIVNNGHSGDSVVDAAIRHGAQFLASGGANAAADVVSSAAAAAVGAWLGGVLGSPVPIIGTIVGGALGALAGKLLNELIDVINPNCDGPLASGLITIPGKELQEKLNANENFGQRDKNPGIDSPSGCGSNSYYRTTWSVKKGSFQSFLLQTGTALHETDNTFDFTMADWNKDGRPDLVAIKKSNTGTKSTEVHILSAASDFKKFLLQTGTALHETDDTFDFTMVDWNKDGRPDLVAIKKRNTGTKSTEVHIFSAASNFKDVLLQTGTALHETDDTFDFTMVDWNKDGWPDLVAIKKRNTDTKSTEVHIFSAASNFKDVLLQTGTALHETDETFDFAIADGKKNVLPDLVAIKKSNTGTKRTEVHVLSGSGSSLRTTKSSL
jgi:hypothetical protein